MKKLLLGTAAVALGLSFAAGSANAQVSLDVGGYTKLYGNWLDQDSTGDDPDTAAADESVDVRELDFARDTEIHFGGETTLDNGLTVGFQTEAEADGSDLAGGGDSFDVQESYAYFSGAWGRVNFGAEDGATYLLQVAAPSADSNIDGLRQYINPISHANLSDLGSFSAGATAADDITLADIFGGGAGSVNAAAAASTGIISDTGAVGASVGDVIVGGNSAAALGALTGRLDYDHANSGYENKLTYMTPVFNGFQAGLSYTPELGSGVGATNGFAGNNLDDTVNDYGSVYELAARYEGQWDQLGFALGGGYSHTELEQATAAGAAPGLGNAVFVNDVDGSGTVTAGDTSAGDLDDREAWNVGVDFDWMAFGLGGAYIEDDNGVSSDALESETWVVGVDYTTGPFKLGASYLTQDQAFGGAELERDRWTGGVVYTYGPGMTFRGSISFTDFEENIGTATATSSASTDADATSFVLGTQIDF